MGSDGSLNRAYRTVWNQALGAMVAVSEFTTARGKAVNQIGASNTGHSGSSGFLRVAVSCLAVAIAWGALPSPVQANPTGGVVIQGQASFTSNGSNLLVTTQNGAGLNHSAIDWQSFSIPTGSTTYFQQPNATSTSINRVVTSTPSLIFGNLGSNGNLVLVNQSGITVGSGAVVDTAGFTASALRMSDADAIAGRLRFGDASTATGNVSVQGSVLARSGDVVLMGASVDTGVNALVQAPNGSTVLAAGQQIEITGRGLEGIVMQVQAPTDSAVNLGTLKGDAVGIFASTLKHSGLIQATTASLEGGKVVLKASGDVYVQDSSQTLATGTSGKGGQIDVLGKRVAVMDNSVLDASGANGGGAVLVGGDLQGKNPDIQNANVTYFGPKASIKADATVQGDGGKIIVWSDDTTRAYGSISARGGILGGNGGMVETSGHRYLDFQGHVDTSAPLGRAGNLLLDPSDITIDNSQLDIGLDTSLLSAQGILTSFLSLNSTLTWATINAQSGSLIVQSNTASLGNGSGNITIGASGTLSGPNSLTLLATNNISFSSGAVVTAGTQAINLYAGWTGSGFSVTSGTGSITFNPNSALTTSGNVRFYAGNGVSQDATATLSAGNLGINSSGIVNLPGINTVGTLAANVSGTTYLNGFIANGLTYVGGNGINVGLIPSDTAGNGVTSGVTTAGGAVSLTANSGNLTANSIVTAGPAGTAATGMAGTSGGAVTLQANTGNITVGSIDTHGGAGGSGTYYQLGQPGGSGGNVSVTQSSGNLSLTGITINTSGGSGGNTSGTIQSAGGNGGAAGSITLQETAGSLTIAGNSSLTANGGNGGNAMLGGALTAGGTGGSAGAITLSSARLGNYQLATTNLSITNTAGTSGNDSTGAVGYLGTVQSVMLTGGGGGVVQTGGSVSSSGTVNVTADAGVTLSNISAEYLKVDTHTGNGAITQTNGSSIVLTYSASITSGTGDVTLANGGNQFGSIGVTSAGNVNLHVAGASVRIDAVSAGSFTLAAAGNVSSGNSVGITTTTGGVSISTTNGLINMSPDNTTNITSAAGITLNATGNIQLNSSVLTAGATGNVVLASSGGLLLANSGTVNVPGGHWFTYLTSPLDANLMGPYTITSSTAGFRQYGKAYGDSTALAQSTGNGNIYSIAASANPFAGTLAGPVSKIYDGLSAVTLSSVALTGVSGNYLMAGDIGGTTVSGVGIIGPHAASNLNVVATAQALGGVTDATNGFPVYGYTITASGNVGTVNTKGLSATATITPVTKVYDGLLAASTSSISGSTTGALNGDSVALDTSALVLNNNTAHAGATTISATGVAAVGTTVGGGSGNKDGTSGNPVAGVASDYSILSTNITNQGVAGAISARVLSSSATITSVAKTYDGMVAASTSSIAGSITGTINGDTATLNTSGEILNNSSAHAGVTSITASGSSAIGTFVGVGAGAKDGSSISNATAGLASDYLLTQPTITNQGVAGTILAKQLTASATIGGLTSKTYDGTLAATGATVSGSTTGTIGSDVVALNTSGLTLSYSDAHVATTGKTIAASGTVAKRCA